MRLIDADALQYSDARDMLPTGQYITREEIDKAAEPIRHGRWIWERHPAAYRCSCCNYRMYGLTLEIVEGDFKYCPSCGAILDPEEDEEENT